MGILSVYFGEIALLFGIFEDFRVLEIYFSVAGGGRGGFKTLWVGGPHRGFSFFSPPSKSPKKSGKGFPGLPPEAREDLCETFWGSRGSGLWRLLYMGIAIARRGLSDPCRRPTMSQCLRRCFGKPLPIFAADSLEGFAVGRDSEKRKVRYRPKGVLPRRCSAHF